MDFLPFIYNQDVRLQEACWINDVPHFTRKAIGVWLGYSHPQKAIDNIIERNPYIDDDRWSSTLNLRGELESGKGQNQTYERFANIRVYNPIGLQLITYESSQPKARAVKIATAHLVYAFMNGELKPPRNIAAQQLYLQCREALNLQLYTERPMAVGYLAEKHNKSRCTVYRWLKRIERGENPALTRLNHHKGRIYMDRDTESQVISLVEESPRITIKEIIRQIPRVDCTSSATIYRIKREVKEQLRQRIINRLDGALLN
jgi:transposase